MSKKIVKILAFFILSGLIFLVSPHEILACAAPARCTPGDSNVCSISECADCSWCTGKVYNPALKDLSNTSGPDFLQKILQLGISLAFVAGAIIFFFMLLVGGISWISGGGDKAKLESAQKKITHALIGLAILLSAFAIIKLVGYLFGIDLSKFTLPTL